MKPESVAIPILAYLDSIVEESAMTQSNPTQDFFGRAAFLLTKEARLAMAIEIRDRFRALHQSEA